MAITNTWLGGSGNWDDPTKWSLGSKPYNYSGTIDATNNGPMNAVFDGSTTGTITISGNETGSSGVKGFTLNNPNATVVVQGTLEVGVSQGADAPLFLNVQSGSLIVDGGTLMVDIGRVYSNSPANTTYTAAYGNLYIKNGGSYYWDSPGSSAGQTVIFQGYGGMILTAPYSGTIKGFQSGDYISIIGEHITNYSFNAITDKLTYTTSSGQQTLNFSGRQSFSYSFDQGNLYISSTYTPANPGYMYLSGVDQNSDVDSGSSIVANVIDTSVYNPIYTFSERVGGKVLVVQQGSNFQYDVQTSDAGQAIDVTVTYFDGTTGDTKSLSASAYVNSLPPAVTAPGAVTNKVKPTISGTGAIGNTVTLTIDGQVIDTSSKPIVVKNDGTWSYTPSTLSEGKHNVSATQVGYAKASNPSDTDYFTVDTTAPTIQSVTLDKSAYKLGDTVTATIRLADKPDGNGDYALGAGSTIDGMTLTSGTYVVVNNYLTATFVVGSQTTELINGNPTVNLTVKDAAGNLSGVNTTAIAAATTIDTHAPTIASATVNGNQLVLSYTETGSGLNGADVPVASEFVVKNGAASNPVTSVAYDATNKTVTLTLQNAVAHSDTVAVSYSPSATPSQNIQDVAGNLAASFTNQAVTNNTPAGGTINGYIYYDNNHNGVPDGGDTPVTGVTVILSAQDGTVYDNRASKADGTYSFGNIAPGSYTVTVSAQTVPKGYVANSALPIPETVTIGSSSTDNVGLIVPFPPVVAITAPIAGDNVINAAEAAAGVTISGTSSFGSGQTVTVAFKTASNASAGTYSTQTRADGAWSVTVPSQSAKALSDGAYTVTADVSDPYVGMAPTASRAISVDETPPTLAITSDKPALKAGETATITFTFSEDPGTTFTWNGSAGDVVVSGGTLGAISGSGLTRTATFTPTADTNTGMAGITVAAGTYADAAGNSGGTGKSPSISFDTQAPAAPSLALTNDTSGGQNVTSDPAITYTPSVQGDTLLYKADGAADYATAPPSFPTDGTADGPHTVLVAERDAAGNIGQATSLTFTLDTKAPAAPSLALTHDTSGGLKITSDPAIGYTASAQGDTLLYKADGAASYSTTAPSFATDGTADGPHTVLVAERDAAGNTSQATSLTFTLDTKAPTLAITSDKPALKAGETATITFSFSEDPGTTFTWNGSAGDVVVSGGTLSAISGSGLTRTATFTPTANIDGGTATITVAAGTYADAAGNDGGGGKSPSISFDTQPPAAPSLALTHDTSGGLKITSDPAIGYTASAQGDTLLYKADGAADYATAPPSFATDGTADGSHTVLVAERDAAGNISQAASLTFTLDTKAPTLAITSDKPALKAGETATITFTFSEDPGTTFTWNGSAGDVVVSGGTLGAISGSGLTRTATFTPTADTNTGTAGITVAAGTYTDTAGNSGGVGKSPSISFDTQAPAAPSLALTNDTSGGQSVTSDPAITYTPSVQGDTLLYKADGAADYATAPPSFPTDGTADGVHTVLVAERDAAGNISQATSLTFTLDTKAPAAPSLALTHDTSGGLKITSDPAIGYTASAQGDTLLYKADGAASYSTTAPSFATDGTADGPHTVLVAEKDAAGNISQAASLTFTLDTKAPTLAITSDKPALKAGESATITFTFSEDPGTTFTWNGSAGDVVVSGGTLGAISGSGLTRTATFTPTADTNTGTATITVAAGTYTDAAGNDGGVGKSPSISFDTQAPAAPSLALTNDTSGGLKITSNASITYTPSVQGDTLLYKADGAASYSTTAPSFATDGTADGPHTVFVAEKDAAGNTSQAASLTFTLDTKAPSAPSLALTNDTSGGLKITSNASITYTPSVQGDTLLYKADGAASYSTTAPSFATNGTADGPHTVLVVEKDAAGNVSQAASLSFTLDTKAPSAPTLMLTHDTGISSSDGITSDASLSVTPAEAGGRLSYGIDGAAVASYDPTTLSQGAHTVSVTQTDAAGNVSAAGTLGFTLDTVAPAASADMASGIGYASALTGNVLANDSDASALHVGVLQYAGGLARSLPATGSVSLDGVHGSLTLAADGSYTYHAYSAGSDVFTYTATDAAGNASQTTLGLSTARPPAPPASQTFAFALTDAVFDFSHGRDLMTTPTGTVVDLTGIGTLSFTDGTVQENDGNPLVDDLFYYATNLDVWRAHADADLHYRLYGWQEGRDPNADFSTKGYLAANPDVAAAKTDPLQHYDAFGWKEGRSPGPNFSAEAYLAQNPDVAAAKIDPLLHYLAFGQAEGRATFAGETRGADGHRFYGDFDADFYLAQNPDVAAAASVAHVSADSFAYTQYLTLGWREGRDPDALFSTNGYLAANPDVAAAGINPLLHYETAGWHEGRDPSSAFHTNAYLAAHPDIAAAQIDPLGHYLKIGFADGHHIA